MNRSKVVNYTEKWMCKNHSWPYIGLSTTIGKSRHLMVLDCDSQYHMLATCHWLKYNNINYYVINSSDNHYWVVTDYISTFSNVFDRLERTPGVDQLYVRYAFNQNMLNIRAHPKNANVPFFPDDVQLQTEEANEWVCQLRNWYKSDDFKRLERLLIVATALAEGRIAEIAANPDFIV